MLVPIIHITQDPQTGYWEVWQDGQIITICHTAEEAEIEKEKLFNSIVSCR